MNDVPNKIKEIANAARNNGFNPVIGNIFLMQSYWKSWWRGNVNDFHHYKEKINGKVVNKQRRTLNSYKMLCEEWESLIWSEDVQVKVTNDDKANQRLQDVLFENNDYLEMGNLIEKYFALGNGIKIGRASCRERV